MFAARAASKLPSIMHVLHRRWKSAVTRLERHTASFQHMNFGRPSDASAHRIRQAFYYGFICLALLYLWVIYRTPWIWGEVETSSSEVCHRGLQHVSIDPSLVVQSSSKWGKREDAASRPRESSSSEDIGLMDKSSSVVDYTPPLVDPSELPVASSKARLIASEYKPERYYHFQDFYLPAVELPKGRFEGRGVVLTASGKIGGQVIGAYVTVYILRRVLKSQLPVEIFFVGQQERFQDHIKKKLTELGDVKIFSLPAVLEADSFFSDRLAHLHVEEAALRGYAAKPYAVYASSFREVMLLDAGVIPFVNPEGFFHFKGYEEGGFQMFRDYRELDRKNWEFVSRDFCADLNEISELLKGTEADSSCLLMDKHRAWDALMVTLAMNGPLQRSTYERLNGDKDTWVLASSITYHNFSTLPTTPGYFMRGPSPGVAMRDATYSGLAEPLRGHVQFVEDEKAPGGVTPLYLNNQCLNFTEYPQMRDRLSFGLWEDYGYPFCGWRAVNPLLKASPRVLTVLDAVAPALTEVGAVEECLCKYMRCRWPSLSGPDRPGPRGSAALWVV